MRKRLSPTYWLMMNSPSSLPIKFSEKKSQILAQLAVPAAAYSDASPKGSVDEGIRSLIDVINTSEGFITTSSCAGRVSVFLDGADPSTTPLPDPGSKPTGSNPTSTSAASGGKGNGGCWLYVSHEPLEVPDEQPHTLAALLLGSSQPANIGWDSTVRASTESSRFIHFKFEPLILHILTASPEHAQLILRCALQAGFRESGAVNIATQRVAGQATPIVAVRSMGLGFESIIGTQTGGHIVCCVSPQYLEMLVRLANERFAQNRKRTERFRLALRDACHGPGPGFSLVRREDASVRSQRKKEEGLRKRMELAAERQRGSVLRESQVPDELEGLVSFELLRDVDSKR